MAWVYEVYGDSSNKTTSFSQSSVIGFTLAENDEKVTKDGSPVLIDRKEGEQLINKSTLTLNLKKETIAKMNDIKDVLNKKFVPLLRENLNEHTSQTTRTLDNLERDDIHFNIEKKVLPKMRYVGPNRKELPISAFR